MESSEPNVTSFSLTLSARPRYYPTIVCDGDNIILIGGGVTRHIHPQCHSSCDAYNTRTGQWIENNSKEAGAYPSLGYSRSLAKAVAINGTIMILGGGGGGGIQLDSVEVSPTYFLLSFFFFFLLFYLFSISFLFLRLYILTIANDVNHRRMQETSFALPCAELILIAPLCNFCSFFMVFHLCIC
jgi:hypothetical protein